MAYNEIQDALLGAMQIIAEETVKKNSDYDKSAYVIVTAKETKTVNRNGKNETVDTGKYTVLYNGQEITGVPCDQGDLNVGDRTLMTIMSNDKKVLVGKSNSSVDGVTLVDEGGVLKGNYVAGDTSIVIVDNKITAPSGGGGGGYSAGDAISLLEGKINVLYDGTTIKLVNNKLTSIGKEYSAGEGISIDSGAINVQYDNSTIKLSNNKLVGGYVAGNGISIQGNTISVTYDQITSETEF